MRLRDEEIMQDRHGWATDSTELVVIFLNSDLKSKIISAQHAGGGAGVNAADGFLHHQRAEQRCALQTHRLKGSLPVSKVKMLPPNLTGEMAKTNIYPSFIKLKSLYNVMCTCFSATTVWAFESTLKNTPPPTHTLTHTLRRGIFIAGRRGVERRVFHVACWGPTGAETEAESTSVCINSTSVHCDSWI